MSAMAMAVTLLTIRGRSFAVYGFPLYTMLINVAIFSVASFPVVSILHHALVMRRACRRR